jgi:2-polyprenyl-3-methyl-5-hydroxy-6-metoxy-1,4-benzoquinol methylase
MSNICKILSDSLCDKHFIPGDKDVKGRQAHRYGPIYDLLLHAQAHKKDAPIKILEIGVATGISLILWSELDFVEHVVGMDILDPELTLNSKITFYNRDAYTQETIDFLKQNHGLFDIIIDDGSHAWHHQEFFLKNYDQLLSEKGVMYCEDIHASFLGNLNALKDEHKLYILDLSRNINVDNNDYVVLKYKQIAI